MKHPAGDRPNSTRRLGRLVWLMALGAAGCGTAQVDTTYGKSRGPSINGTGALAELIRGRGHPVRAAVRCNEVLAAWADVLVRIAPTPGPPGQEEGEWLATWLHDAPGRKLVYVVRDYDGEPEFWSQMLAALPRSGRDEERRRIEARKVASQSWASRLPERAQHPATIGDWFGTEPPRSAQPGRVTVCRTLDGPWAVGIDAQAAALPQHETIRIENNENILLSGDGANLAISWSFRDDDEPEADRGGVLVLANGSFLLNAGLLNRARRPLATRVVDWIGDGSGHVAFVEGANALGGDESPQMSPFHLLTVAPFDWVAVHLAAFGGLLALALATTIGRPRPEPAAAVERTSAHAVALGSILAQTKQVTSAREILLAYRRWRHPAGGHKPPSSPPPSSRRAPHA